MSVNILLAGFGLIVGGNDRTIRSCRGDTWNVQPQGRTNMLVGMSEVGTIFWIAAAVLSVVAIVWRLTKIQRTLDEISKKIGQDRP